MHQELPRPAAYALAITIFFAALDLCLSERGDQLGGRGVGEALELSAVHRNLGMELQPASRQRAEDVLHCRRRVGEVIGNIEASAGLDQPEIREWLEFRTPSIVGCDQYRLERNHGLGLGFDCGVPNDFDQTDRLDHPVRQLRRRGRCAGQDSARRMFGVDGVTLSGAPSIALAWRTTDLHHHVSVASQEPREATPIRASSFDGKPED